eukprot:14612621-Alexandrium_andersonii.AAC.1
MTEKQKVVEDGSCAIQKDQADNKFAALAGAFKDKEKAVRSKALDAPSLLQVIQLAGGHCGHQAKNPADSAGPADNSDSDESEASESCESDADARPSLL